MKPTPIGALLMFFLTGCAGLTQNWVPKPETPEQARARQAVYLAKLEQKKIDRVSFVPFSSVFAPTEFGSVSIMSGQPSAPHTEIGLLTITGGDGIASLTLLLRKKAAAVGADAIIKYETLDIPTGSSESGGISVGYNKKELDTSSSRSYSYVKRISGIAIKYPPK